MRWVEGAPGDPQGQRELQDYVEQRLGQARTVINDAMATADENARKTRELTDRYAGVGQEGNRLGRLHDHHPASGGDTSGATTPASGGDTSEANTPTTVATPAARPPQPAVATPVARPPRPAAATPTAGAAKPTRRSNRLLRPIRSARACRWAVGCR